jgi:hypothetical protein
LERKVAVNSPVLDEYIGGLSAKKRKKQSKIFYVLLQEYGTDVGISTSELRWKWM